MHPAYQVYPWECPAAASLRAVAHVAQFGKVEDGAYVDAVVVRFQGVAEELVCRVHIVFGREAAQHQEVAASGFAAVGGYGECQLYILSVGGRDVGARCVNRFREAAQIG